MFPEIHDNLHPDTELQVVFCTLPGLQPIIVMDVALDCDIIRKLAQLDGGVAGSAVIGVQRVQIWGQNTALSSSSVARQESGCQATPVSSCLPGSL